MSDRIRVLVVATGGRLTGRLALALPARAPVALVGPVRDASGAVAALADGRVDLVVVDLDRADGRGVDVIASVVAGGGRGRVMAASDDRGLGVAADALFAGASGVVPHDLGGSLVEVFRRALAGELVLPADDLSRLVDTLTSPAGSDRRNADSVGSLTNREREVLRTLAAGASTADVAEAFGISPLTVQSHVKNILAKLGVHSKVEAVRLAFRHGLATTSRPSADAG